MTAFSRSRDGRWPRAAAGFSLVELAIGIAIIALLLGSLLVPLQSQVESRKVADTQKILDNAREALLGYAAANGYFPCPADYAGGSAGAEATGSTHTAGSGTCPSIVTGGVTPTVYIGYLPAVTLGFTPTDMNGYAVDAWQTRVRYAVSATTVNSVNRPFTNSGGMRSALMPNILGATLLSVCNTATGASNTACASAATTLTSNAIAVIWSLGANAATSGGTSTDEAANFETLANANRVFVMRDLSKVIGTEFDDIVVWISTPILFSRLIAAGQLP